MSRSESSKPSTRIRILEAAVAALEDGQGILQMGAVADRAGVSRQAVYLHFRNRAELAVALARYTDEKYGLEAAIAPIEAAASAEAILAAYGRFLEDYNPRIHRVASMAYAMRRTDPDSEAAWQDRLVNRRSGGRRIAERIAGWGRLAPGLTAGTAGDWLAALGSVALWEELVLDLGWPGARYVDMIVRSSQATLLGGRAG